MNYFAIPNNCFDTSPSQPSKVKITSSASKSIRHPKIVPPRHEGKLCGDDLAPYQISLRQPSKAIEYLSSPIPKPSYNESEPIKLFKYNITVNTYMTQKIRVLRSPANLHNTRCYN